MNGLLAIFEKAKSGLLKGRQKQKGAGGVRRAESQTLPHSARVGSKRFGGTVTSSFIGGNSLGLRGVVAKESSISIWEGEEYEPRPIKFRSVGPKGETRRLRKSGYSRVHLIAAETRGDGKAAPSTVNASFLSEMDTVRPVPNQYFSRGDVQSIFSQLPLEDLPELSPDRSSISSLDLFSPTPSSMILPPPKPAPTCPLPPIPSSPAPSKSSSYTTSSTQSKRKLRVFIPPNALNSHMPPISIPNDVDLDIQVYGQTTRRIAAIIHDFQGTRTIYAD